ncbi:MAG TPA: hypothetical protein VLJ11_02840 [Bryobacteraceae bacterium]|nr:hypothetical protein [Bryobacteraceae bacterium]
MKNALLGLLLLTSPMLADSMLSLQGYFGGTVVCSNHGTATAGCTAQTGSSSFGTNAYTTGSLNLSGSDLVFSLNGSLEAAQGILAHSNPMSAFSAVLPVSDTSGNWIVSGSATTSGYSRYALNIFVNGSPAGLIGNGSSSFEVHHTLGAPLTFSLADNVSAPFSNDIENLKFSLTFTDPPADAPAAAPEPATLLLVTLAFGLLLSYKPLNDLFAGLFSTSES